MCCCAQRSSPPSERFASRNGRRNKPAPVSALVIAFVLALVTVSDVAGESLLHEMFKASGIIGELAVKIHDRIPQVFRDWLVAVHSFHLQLKWLVFYMLNGKWGGCPSTKQ